MLLKIPLAFGTLLMTKIMSTSNTGWATETETGQFAKDKIRDGSEL